MKPHIKHKDTNAGQKRKDPRIVRTVILVVIATILTLFAFNIG